MEILAKIDWLSITTENRPTFPRGLSVTYRDTVPARGYNAAIAYIPDKRKISWHTQRDDMKIHTTYTGSTINLISDYSGITDMELLTHHRLHDNAKITRLDIALDVIDSGILIRELHKSARAGDIITKSRKYAHVTSNSGETLYIGSRQSEKFARIYDKAAELGLDGDHIRIELELKGDKAVAAAEYIDCAEDKPYAIQSIIRGFMNFPSYRTWAHIMRGVPGLALKAKPSKSNTRAWLLEQCAPALAKYCVLDDETILEEFNDIVQSSLERISSELIQDDGGDIIAQK